MQQLLLTISPFLTAEHVFQAGLGSLPLIWSQDSTFATDCRYSSRNIVRSSSIPAIREMLQRLPEGVLERIISILSSSVNPQDVINDCRNQCTLAAISRVNKRLDQLARPQLYRCIRVENRNLGALLKTLSMVNLKMLLYLTMTTGASAMPRTPAGHASNEIR
jgi:hypothetical protein